MSVRARTQLNTLAECFFFFLVFFLHAHAYNIIRFFILFFFHQVYFFFFLSVSRSRPDRIKRARTRSRKCTRESSERSRRTAPVAPSPLLASRLSRLLRSYRCYAPHGIASVRRPWRVQGVPTTLRPAETTSGAPKYKFLRGSLPETAELQGGRL